MTSRLIILDWDDTLCPSSYLSQNNLAVNVDKCLIPEHVAAELKQLEDSMCKLIHVCKQHGQVCIITNAEDGWVELSAGKFLPGSLEVLSGVEIMSARSTFELDFPAAPFQWKLSAFRAKIFGSAACLLDDFDDQEPAGLESAFGGEVEGREGRTTPTPTTQFHEVVSLGDSQAEREAVFKCGRSVQNASLRCKSIKLVRQPSIEALRQQQVLLAQALYAIFLGDKDVDLMLSINQEPANG